MSPWICAGDQISVVLGSGEIVRARVIEVFDTGDRQRGSWRGPAAFLDRMAFDATGAHFDFAVGEFPGWDRTQVVDRPQVSGAVMRASEGVTWCRGWEPLDVAALGAACALAEPTPTVSP